MYRPNFCAECGAQIVRVRWRLWTSRRFCDACAGRLRRARIMPPLIACLSLLGLGLIAGRTMRRAPPQLIIAQKSEAAHDVPASAAVPAPVYGADGSATERPTDPNEVVSICGARTKKGTPCSRRVRGTGRCWQHKGLPAMLPPEKLIVAGN
ncbi:MAG: hypothetical protein JO360_18185 [Acidobacteria bacterium]|nr:hypothetical protein [Acidobacteriota bacterium]